MTIDDLVRDPWALLVGLAALAVWIWLLSARGGYWRAAERLDDDAVLASAPDGGWPAVTAIVPARNESATVADCLESLLGQDYPGRLDIVLVDDASTDDTAWIAEQFAEASAGRLTVVAAPPLPDGWSGKLWALNAGLAASRETAAPYLLMTDADIRHDPRSLKRLVGAAQAGDLDLVSVMVRLWAGGGWARLLIPAFTYFFAKLYPFAWVNDPRRRTAAAAGGALLVRRAALEAAGGLEAMRDALIDDVTLARRIKRRPPGGHAIRLALGRRVVSLRPYQTLGDVWSMVARTAFTELDHSGLKLVGTVIGMALAYLVPPALAVAGTLAGDPVLAGLGLAGWALMAVSFRPMLAYAGQPGWLAAALPVAGLLYTLMTLDSARQHWLGRGGRWKGRAGRAGRAGAGRRRPGDA